MRGQVASPQVHQEEGEVIGDVDARQFLVELDAVEEGRHAADQHHVAQVQIAVTVAHPPVPASSVEARLDEGEHRSRIARQACDVLGSPDPGRIVQEAARVAVDHPRHARGAAPRVVPGGLRVEPCDGLPERRHQADVQRASRREPVQQRLLIEPAHADQPLDGLAMSAEGELAVGLPGDGHHIEVQLRGGAPVQAQLLLAHGAPAFHGREVEVVVADGPLHLPRTIAGEEDDGRVGFDRVDGQPAVCGACAEKRDDSRLVFGDHGDSPAALRTSRWHR